MTLIAEWSSGLYALEKTFERVPDLELSLEEIHPVGDGEGSSMAFYHWASTVDFEEFEAAARDDPHCETVTHLSEVGGRRLYRVTASEEGMRAVLYPVAAENDLVVLDTSLTRDGVRTRVRAPNRCALTAVRRAVEERGVRFSLDTLYREQGSDDDYSVTEPQREALLAALDAGYFDVPRRTTLGEVADAYDISDQALSARLRRGQANLLRSTLADEEPDT